MNSGRNFFNQSVNNDLRRYDFTTGQGDNFTNGSSLDYPYLKE